MADPNLPRSAVHEIPLKPFEEFLCLQAPTPVLRPMNENQLNISVSKIARERAHVILAALISDKKVRFLFLLCLCTPRDRIDRAPGRVNEAVGDHPQGFSNTGIGSSVSRPASQKHADPGKAESVIAIWA